MKTVALCAFIDRPWERLMVKALERSLHESYDVSTHHGYPPKNKHYDLLFLVGIRPVIKLNLDAVRLRSAANIIIDFGDISSDSRQNIEDLYFYFYDHGPVYAKHYRKLPKFIFEDLLYPEQDDKLFTVFVDHYTDRESYLELVFSEIEKCPFELKVFYQSHTGIVENPTKKEQVRLIDQRSPSFTHIPFEEIAVFYRKTHIFLPTHRETQGMVPLEIGACGGLTLMKPFTFPQEISSMFYHALYDETHHINWEKARKLALENKAKYRAHVLNNFSIQNFRHHLLEALSTVDS